MPLAGRNTKVFAIGGTGRIGRVSSKILAANEIVSQVAIAARDLSLAKEAAADLGSKGMAIEADATNEARLASLVRDYDLVVNTAGPDFRVALPVTRAAISAGVHCCDIAADGPSLEKVLALDGQAKEAGVTVVTGIGHVPGTDAGHPVRVRRHGAAPTAVERTPPSPIAANCDREGRRRRGDDGVPRRDRGRSGSVASKPGQGPDRLRHDGDRDGYPEETAGALLLLARWSLGIHDRAAHRRGAANPPWKGPCARRSGRGSRLRNDPVPGRSSAIPI